MDRETEKTIEGTVCNEFLSATIISFELFRGCHNGGYGVLAEAIFLHCDGVRLGFGMYLFVIYANTLEIIELS